MSIKMLEKGHSTTSHWFDKNMHKKLQNIGGYQDLYTFQWTERIIININYIQIHWIGLAQSRNRWRALVNLVPSGFTIYWETMEWPNNWGLSSGAQLHSYVQIHSKYTQTIFMGHLIRIEHR
jgi:hypothetical protein